MSQDNKLTVELKYTCVHEQFFFDLTISTSLIPDLAVGQTRAIEDFDMTATQMYERLKTSNDHLLDHNMVYVLNVLDTTYPNCLTRRSI